MARAAVAFGQASGGCGVLDGPAARYPCGEPHVAAALSVGAGGLGEVLPASAGTAAPAGGQGEDCLAESEVMLGRLWFELSPEARTRFGGCFSRMVLKALRCSEGCVTEDST